MIEAKLKEIAYIEDIPAGRMLEIKIKRTPETPKTPLRGLSYKDLKEKRKVPTASPLFNPILVVDLPISPEKFSEEKERANRYFSLKINELNNLMGDVYPIQYPIPYIYPSHKKGGNDLLEDEESIMKHYFTTLILMFKETEYKEVLIPPLKLGFSAYRKVLHSILHFLYNRMGIQGIPVFDLRNPNFPQLMKSFVEEEEHPVVGLKYRKVSSALAYYRMIRNEFYDKDVLFIMLDSDIHENFQDKIEDYAIIQALNLLGIDVVIDKLSTGLPPPPQQNQEGTLSRIRQALNRLRLLNRTKFIVPSVLRLHRNEIHYLLTDSEVSKEDEYINTMVDILSDKKQLLKIASEYVQASPYNKEEKDEYRRAKEKYDRIKALTAVQELKASTKEFYLMQKFIRENDLRNYLNQRPNLGIVLDVVRFKKLA